MITLLSDHNIEGQSHMLWRILQAQGWFEFLPVTLVYFADVGLPHDASDRTVWRFVQTNQMLLLTANRNMLKVDSLEQTIREENQPDSLPVLTISNARMLGNGAYRKRCADRLIEVLFDLQNRLGSGRVFIP